MSVCPNETSTVRLPNPAHLRMLDLIRTQELELAMRHFPVPSTAKRPYKVLEIGAGTGKQAAQIRDAGYDVLAIDLAQSHYRRVRVHDVLEYDGKTIPMRNQTADVIFSSNVLEHVAHIDELLAETRRVLARGGVAIHVLPSATCRLWSLPAHYVWLLERLYRRWFPERLPTASHSSSIDVPRKPRNISEWLSTLFPTRHGERGSAVTELWYFSRPWWYSTFQKNGFIVKKMEPNRLFYTMSNSLGDRISIRARTRLSRYLGSSCTIYVLHLDTN